MCATYKDKQKRSHFESFANKIFTGIREINSEYAEKRAIWELFQNALDTVDTNGIIEIVETERGLLFKHNGRPFTDDEFGGLIKQFSVGKTYGDNKEKLGQYGTGFISTHVYGKSILINGSIKTDDGSYRSLCDFELDRHAPSIEILTDKLLEQDKRIEELCDNAELVELEPMPFISFEYQASENNLKHIQAMLTYVESILHYIFCFNDRLSKVTLNLKSGIHEYLRLQSLDGLIEISKNGKKISIPFLQDDHSQVKVIMGNNGVKVDDIPKQFLFYPLIETVDAGYNFIIHADEFKPNKERDYLHKDRANEELGFDVATNEKLLQLAFNLAIKKVSEDVTLTLIDIAGIEFTQQDSDFEKELKCEYIRAIRSLKRTAADNEKYTLEELHFFDETVLVLETNKKESIYTLLSQFRSLPPFGIYCELSRQINNWNSHISKAFETLGLPEIAIIVAEDSDGKYFHIKNKEAFQVFVSDISSDISLLNKVALIPNIHGNFKHYAHLVRWETNEPALVSIVDNIDASISDRYVHPHFASIPNLTPYNRTSFKDDLNKLANALIDKFAKNTADLSRGTVRFIMLRTFLNNYVGLNKKTQLNLEVANFYKRVYYIEPMSEELISPTVDLNYYASIKLLAHLYISDISAGPIASRTDEIKEIVGIMFRNTNLKDELLDKLTCIPNQNHVLKSQKELKCDDVKDDDFKFEYDELTKNNIREELAAEGFEQFLQHGGHTSGSELGDKIEIFLSKDKKFIPVGADIVDKLLKLIEKISEKPNTWGQWLPNINRVKEEVLMHKFQDESTRSSLFSILTKNEKTIELLGDLAKLDDLEDLIKKGKERQTEENRKSNHLNYINHIGLVIQELIEEQLDIELASTFSILNSEKDHNLITQEEQNGQDFIIYKNEVPIYYIEVKSKWDENGRFALSKNQTEKCAAEYDKYAVISVNVDRYKKTHKIDFNNIPFDDLKEFVSVNDNLGNDFKKLISENLTKKESNDPKLIEFRGSIPQKVIDERGEKFDVFIKKLIHKIIAV